MQTQNRQRLAEPQLPDEVVRQGVTVKKTSPSLLAVVALSSTDPKHNDVYLSNYALLRIIPPSGVTVDAKRRPYVVIDPRIRYAR